MASQHSARGTRVLQNLRLSAPQQRRGAETIVIWADFRRRRIGGFVQLSAFRGLNSLMSRSSSALRASSDERRAVAGRICDDGRGEDDRESSAWANAVSNGGRLGPGFGEDIYATGTEGRGELVREGVN